MTGRLRVIGAGTALLVTAACGVPTGGPPSTIARSDVPAALLSPSEEAVPAPATEPTVEPSRVFLVTATGQLVPRARDLAAQTRRERLEALLAQLGAGPTTAELEQQLSTGLPPGVRLEVTGLTDQTVTVDIGIPAEAPSGRASRRAVAQIVLTATSVPGVEAVLLTLGGAPVEAPLPDGQLTSEPLHAAEFESFLAGGAPGSPGPVPAAPSAATPTR